MDASQLRPLGVGEIIDAGIRITRRRFRDLAILVAVVAVPAQILQLLVAISAPESTNPFNPGGASVSPGSAPDAGDTLTQLAATLVTLVIGFLTALLATAACTEVVSSEYLGGEITWRESLRRAWRRFASLVVANLLILLVAGLGLLACLVPGVWLWVAFSVAVPAILIEGIRGPASLRRSFRLVRGRWWPVFAILLVGQLLVLVVQSFVTLPLVPILFLTGGDNAVVGFLVTAASTVVSTIVTQPFIAAVTVIIYYDLRVRKEGFDLALMAAQLDAPPVAVAPTGWEPTPRRPSDEPAEPPPPVGPQPRPPPGWDRKS